MSGSHFQQRPDRQLRSERQFRSERPKQQAQQAQPVRQKYQPQRQEHRQRREAPQQPEYQERHQSSPEPAPRYALLDVLRGLCLLSMIAYHAMYDVVYLLGRPVPWFTSTPGYLWQQSICWTFILLSGAACNFSHHPFRHGLVVTLGGLLVSAVTYFLMPSEVIWFGVLSMLGLSSLLLSAVHALFNKIGRHIPPWLGLAISAVLFFLTRNVPRKYLGFEALRLLRLPESLYQFDLLSPLGFPGPHFVSSDYFPMIPWFFLFLTGYFLWKVLARSEGLTRFLQKRPAVLRPVAFLGRHSLWIYLLHQPVLLGVFLLLTQYLHVL